MDRLLTHLSRVQIAAALALATVAYLAVPEGAFADDPSTCAANCESTYGSGNSSYWACVAGCCNTDDPGDPACCAKYCDPSDPECVPNCSALLATLCVKGFCELPKNNPAWCNVQLPTNCAAGGCVTTGQNCSASCECLFTVGSSVPCWCQLP